MADKTAERHLSTLHELADIRTHRVSEKSQYECLDYFIALAAEREQQAERISTLEAERNRLERERDDALFVAKETQAKLVACAQDYSREQPGQDAQEPSSCRR